MRIALDTNILAYAEGVQRDQADASKIAMSRQLLTGLIEDLGSTPVLPIQALIELHNVLTRKGGRSPDEAGIAVHGLAESIELAPTSAEALGLAVDLAGRHRLQIFDAIILAAGACAGCDLLLSEDLQDGFRAGGLTVANPFSDQPHRALAGLLRG